MRALILEQRYDGGHYLNWVKLVVLSLMDLASEIVVGIPAAAKNSSQYRLALAPIQDRFRLYDLPPDRPANRFNMIRRLAKIASQAIADVRPDALYFPTSDGSVDAKCYSCVARIGSAGAGLGAITFMWRRPIRCFTSRRGDCVVAPSPTAASVPRSTRFSRPLAEDQSEYAIGIVLSGAGSHGKRKAYILPDE